MEQIITLYNSMGNSEYFGENVSKTTHMIQSAIAAMNNDEPDFIILSCLLHDIGHLLEKDNMNGLGVSDHGLIGANYLRELGIQENVCSLVENHVNAKKYLVSKHPEYYNKLSLASKKTLEYQGGKMNTTEMELFEKLPEFHNILKVRYYDDIGKQVGMNIPSIDFFTYLIHRFIMNPPSQ